MGFFMGGKDANYQQVMEGEELPHFVPGGMVFFQRARKYGAGYWFGYTHVDGFEFIVDHPIRVYDGLIWLVNRNKSPQPSPDDFKLE